MFRHRTFEIEKLLINPVICNCFTSVLVLFLAFSQLLFLFSELNCCPNTHCMLDVFEMLRRLLFRCIFHIPSGLTRTSTLTLLAVFLPVELNAFNIVDIKPLVFNLLALQDLMKDKEWSGSFSNQVPR